MGFADVKSFAHILHNLQAKGLSLLGIISLHSITSSANAHVS